jgi:hypothetical protein
MGEEEEEEERVDAFAALMRGASRKRPRPRPTGVGVGMGACPVCRKKYGSAQLDLHVNSCLDKAAARTSPRPRPSPSPVSSVAAAEGDAFAALMSASRRANFGEEFWLLESGKKFTWGWGASGSGPGPERDAACWSCTVPSCAAAPGTACRLWTNVAPSPAASFPPDPLPSGLSRFNVSHLKSLLQKNVRRRRAEAAVKCATELLLRSWQDFVRRLPVIMIEDACLHPALPLVVFIMLAGSRGYCPPNSVLSAMLEITHELASGDWHDDLEDDGRHCDLDGAGSGGKQQLPMPRDFSTLPPVEGALCRSLLFRAGYGGMKGDVAMMARAALVWKSRLSVASSSVNTQPILEGKAAPLSYIAPEMLQCLSPKHQATLQAIQGGGIAEELLTSCNLFLKGGGRGALLRAEDAIPAGIDFHCSNILDDAMRDEDLLSRCGPILIGCGDIMAALKTAMWKFRSGVNARAAPISSADWRQKQLLAAWKAIAPKVEEICRRFIAARLCPDG